MTQQAIYNAVGARGYLDGLERRQIAARNIAKLSEELAELAERIILYPVASATLRDSVLFARYAAWYAAVQHAGQLARELFDLPNWSDAEVGIKPGADAEAADAQVVLLVLAEALGVDLLATAARKAAAGSCSSTGRGPRCGGFG